MDAVSGKRPGQRRRAQEGGQAGRWGEAGPGRPGPGWPLSLGRDGAHTFPVRHRVTLLMVFILGGGKDEGKRTLRNAGPVAAWTSTGSGPERRKRGYTCACVCVDVVS